MIIGPSNWTICLRKLLVYHDRTLENSTKGPDCTFLPLHPNFTDLVPVIPGHMDYALPNSFCQPGKHLYLLTSPVCSSSQPVSAVHIHVFGTMSDAPGDWDTSTWLSCGIIRRSEGNGELIEIASSHVRLIVCPRGIIQGSSPVEYSMIHVFNSDEEFTREIKHGDMIALWAHSYRGQLHTPRSASIKVNSYSFHFYVNLTIRTLGCGITKACPNDRLDTRVVSAAWDREICISRRLVRSSRLQCDWLPHVLDEYLVSV